MLYLNKEDSKILFRTYMMIVDLFCDGKLNKVQEKALAEFSKLLSDSTDYSVSRREKAKKKVQEMRKADKTYAHTRKGKTK